MKSKSRGQPSLVNDGIDKEGLAFSKGIVICSLVVYFIIVFIVLYLIMGIIDINETAEPGTLSAMGSSLSWASGALAACITSSVALPVTSVVWYLKKTHLSYATKVQGDVGRSMASVELGFIRGVKTMQKEFNIPDSEADRLINQSQAHRLKESLFQDVTTTARIGVSEGTETIRKEV